MASILSNLRKTVLASLVLVLVLFIIMGIIHKSGYSFGFTKVFWQYLLRWIHVGAGIMWIGILYYFNFVQIPTMPKIPNELKPGVSKFIAPEALFWFRWAAMTTMIAGIVLAILNGYLLDAAILGIASKVPQHTMIGIGMWLGMIMWFNVWFVIWPNQKIALGLVDGTAEAKAKAARTAMLFSRTNTMLSLPMLYCMVMAKGGY